MEKVHKDHKYELEVRGHKSKKVKVIVKDTYIRIDIPGKTYIQIRDIVEKAVYPSKKSAYKKAIYKSFKGQEVLIRIFIQNELNAFYEEFAKEKGLEIKAEYPYIKNYREHEGCIESIFDIVIIFLIEKTVESVVRSIVEPIVEELVRKFKEWIKHRLEERLKGKVGREEIKVDEKKTEDIVSEESK